MNQSEYQIRLLTDDTEPLETGKRSTVLADDANMKVVLLSFATGNGLAEHVAPLPAILQIIDGEATLTVGSETVEGTPGTWIRMAPKTPHSIQAKTPVLLLLTLFK